MHSVLAQFGYLDPGTGSIIIQAVVGVTAGIAVFGRKVINNAAVRARSLLARKGQKEDIE